MKRLSDYKGDEAIELWADLITPITAILSDAEVKDIVTSGKSKMQIAQIILKKHKGEAVEILTKIDDTPINGLNIVLRVANLLTEIGENEDIKSFFGYSEQEKTQNESFGSPMENTEDGEN